MGGSSDDTTSTPRMRLRAKENFESKRTRALYMKKADQIQHQLKIEEIEEETQKQQKEIQRKVKRMDPELRVKKKCIYDFYS